MTKSDDATLIHRLLLAYLLNTFKSFFFSPHPHLFALKIHRNKKKIKAQLFIHFHRSTKAICQQIKINNRFSWNDSFYRCIQRLLAGLFCSEALSYIEYIGYSIIWLNNSAKLQMYIIKNDNEVFGFNKSYDRFCIIWIIDMQLAENLFEYSCTHCERYSHTHIHSH